MSIKSYKSKLSKRIISCAVAGSLSLSACIYSGSKTNSGNNLHLSEESTRIMFCEAGLTGINEITTTTTTTTVTTSTTSVKTTTTTTTNGTTTVTTQPITEAITESVNIETDTKIDEVSVEVFIEEENVDTYVEETTPVETYAVFKPSTHYIHMNTCRWCNDECYRIDNADGLEARKCSECNPDIEITTPYEEPAPTYTYSDTAIQVTDYEFTILCNLVAGEYGSDIVSIYDKGAVVATVIHRMQEGTRWTNGLEPTVYNVIAAPYQYNGKYLSSEESSKVTQSCRDAVTYALNNMSEYEYYTNPDGTSVYMINSFTGDGRYNWFRHS